MSTDIIKIYEVTRSEQLISSFMNAKGLSLKQFNLSAELKIGSELVISSQSQYDNCVCMWYRWTENG